MITGRGRYVDDMVVPGMLYMAVVRSPRRTRRSPRSTPRRRRRCRASTASSRAPTSTSPPRCRWRGSAGRRDQDARAQPLAKDGSTTSARASPSWSARTSTPCRRRRAGVRRLRPAARGRRPRAALEDGAALVHPEFGTNQVTSGRSAAATWTRRGPSPRSSSSGGSSTTARPAPRSSRAWPSPTTAATSSRCTSRRNPHLIRLFMAGELEMSEDRIRVIAPDVGGGFGVKISHFPEEGDHRGLDLAQGRPRGQVDRDARTEHMGLDDPRPRPDRLREGRRQARRHDRRPRVHRDLRLRRLLHAADAVHPSFTGFVISGCCRSRT